MAAAETELILEDITIISYHSNLFVWSIYFSTFLSTIRLFSSVKLSEPNNKFAIEITVYGVIFINNCILAFATDNFDNEVDQRSDELLYMAAVETELILEDITNITEIENRNQRLHFYDPKQT
jgi:hypothetical protein